MTVISRWATRALIFISFIGVLDASYLTIKFYRGGHIPCAVLDGCNTVTTSIYSTIGPIPIALIGTLYYLFVFILALYFEDTSNKLIPKVLVVLTTISLIASMVLVFIQGFILSAYCLYCLISAFISIMLFLISIFLYKSIQVDSPMDKMI